MNMELKRKLPTPQTIKDMYPVSEELAMQKEKNDRQIRAILTGEDDRLMLLIGPCSADREDAVLDYVGRLREIQERGKAYRGQILSYARAMERIHGKKVKQCLLYFITPGKTLEIT